ncbi:amino acid ABC transporter substrate-binding protein [Piscinibacter terrae]|uniref:Amino acid ABC transporter substrate-binding protein n=1 Tax=Piscinibacter terrae TaxID=2496871 RepID=A0A3N7HP44_9BURK|nr:amino acid ABC transporter substrate-binding protein [Albitalea terrae]RQP22886.1 amino acid ABC transporter substrate-binding protein [Albitalea terrae]
MFLLHPLRWALALTTGLLAASTGLAAESMTLRKIQETGVVTIGYRDASIPLSYLDSRQKPIGYSIDICQRIVDAVKSRLQMNELTVRMVPVTSATRIPLVANGTVDLECGVTTNNAERQQQVAFTVTTFVAESRVLSKKSSPVQTVSALQGKTVVSTAGTTSVRHLQDLGRRRGMDLTILAAKDDTEALRMVDTDRANAYAMDDVLLRSAVATSGRPEDYVISDDALSVEPYGIMLNRHDPEFKRLADEAIISLFNNGEIYRLYHKWFRAPIPPKGINLQMPLSPALERAYLRPTDSPDPATYR